MVWPNSSKRVYPSLGLVGLFSAVLVMLSSAALDVGDRSQWADENTTISISCTPSEAISFLRWYETTLGGELSSATQIVQLFTLDGTVTWSAGVDQSHFQFDSGSADYPLTVKSVTLEDEGSYWCEVELDSGNPNEQEDVELQIRKIPTVVELMHIDTGANYSNGENVSIIAGENRFSCAVPGIKPAAKFIWELDSKDLNTFDERNVTSSEDPRLVDSSSTLTVTVEADSTLKCSAQNKQDGTTAADVTLTVTLKLKPDPCKINPCQNGGTCRDVNGEPECKCPDGFTGVTCGGRASTTPASTTEYGITSDLGSDTTKEVSTTGASTTVVSTSTDPPTPGSTTWMVSGGTDQFSTKPTMPLVTTGTDPGTSGPTPILTSEPTPISTTDDVDRGGSTDGLTTGKIVGICVGAVAFVAILLVLTLCILCRESLRKQCSCLQCKSSVNPEKEGAINDKEALELNGGSTSNKEKEEG